MKLSTLSPRRGAKASLPPWIPVFALVATLLSCNSGDDDDDDPPETRPWLYEHEFDDDPSLFADPEQIVILDLLPDDGPGEVEHSIRYRHQAQGSWLLAVAPDDSLITRVELRDRVGGVMEGAEVSEGGVFLDIAPGDYSLMVYHDGSKVPEEGTVAFVYPQTTVEDPTASADADGEEATPPIPWVSPAHVALKVVGGDHAGRYLATEKATGYSEGIDRKSVLVFKAVSPGTDPDVFADRAHLFTFVGTTERQPCGEGGTEHNYELHSWSGDAVAKDYGFFLYFCSDRIGCPSSNRFPVPTWTQMPGFYPDSEHLYPGHIQDQGDGTFSLLLQSNFGECSPPYVAQNGYLYFTQWSDGRPAETLEVERRMRFFADGGKMIDRATLLTGEVALYQGTDYSGAAVILSGSLEDATLIPFEQVGSVAFGLYTDTTVELFGDTDYNTSLGVVGVDTTGLSLTGIRSIRVFESRKRLIDTKACPYCNLAAVDLTDQTSLDDANLTHANLQSARLNSIGLTGADLSFALLSGANLGNANLAGASLFNASLDGNADLNLAAAIVSGAHLKNANLKGANLGGVKFQNASFYSQAYSATGCAQDPDNPGFSKGCASAQGAHLTNTDFSGAYLAGTDFSGSIAKATNFSNAVLVGAKFTGTSLDWVSANSTRSSLEQAFIGGANFGNTTVEGTDFKSAYVDVNPRGATWLFILDPALTQFPGFDPAENPLGHAPCVEFSFGDPTVVPTTTDGNNICVNGNNGPCGDTTDPSWTSPVDPYDKTESSKSTDSPSACTFDKIYWDW